jgi:hypothetical protein
MYLRSFTKSDWQIPDYPLRFRRQGLNPQDYGRLKLPAWSVQVINWWQLDGLGDTKEEAYLDLKANFERLKAEGGELPRPELDCPLNSLSPVRQRAISSLRRISSRRF